MKTISLLLLPQNYETQLIYVSKRGQTRGKLFEK